MSNILIYPKELCAYIDKTGYIPKKVKFLDDIRKFSKYIYLEACNDGFKVEDIIDVDNQIYYQIRLLDNSRQAVIPYDESFHYYELLTDKENIINIDNIINTDIPYYGSEIKYWFYTHKIDLKSGKYSGFKPLVTKSNVMISDRKIYFLYADYSNIDNEYINCRAVLFRK